MFTPRSIRSTRDVTEENYRRLLHAILHCPKTAEELRMQSARDQRERDRRN